MENDIVKDIGDNINKLDEKTRKAIIEGKVVPIEIKINILIENLFSYISSF